MKEKIFALRSPKVVFYSCAYSGSPPSAFAETRHQEVTTTSRTWEWSDTTQKSRTWSGLSAWLRSISPRTTKSHTTWPTSSSLSTTNTTASCTSEQVRWSLTQWLWWAHTGLVNICTRVICWMVHIQGAFITFWPLEGSTIHHKLTNTQIITYNRYKITLKSCSSSGLNLQHLRRFSLVIRY